jgi:ferredoxin
MEITVALLIVLALLTLVCLGGYGFSSWRERERRAARVAFGVALTLSLAFGLSALLPDRIRLAILSIVALGLLGGVVLFLLPIGRIERGPDVPHKRFDERDIMFARARLEPGSANYETYYAMRPANKAGDDRTRSLPGLLALDASEGNPPLFAATGATFDLIDTLRSMVEGQPTGERIEQDPEGLASILKGLARYWGAHSVGITELQPYHVYSHIGRGSGEYGAPIRLDHAHALAFTVEMDRAMVDAAPAAPTLLESARQYAVAAQIAIQVADFLRSQGYPARAHIDGNYRVIAPLVARDAGLGELGRMGLLMTPALGPRVRLGVVTTEAPLFPDPRSDDPSVLDFCSECKKCADCCPVRAIPFGDREEIDGALRWRIKDDVCFRYWNVVGTDCARCMAVCPYSHPDSPIHDLTRWAVRHSGGVRRAAIWLDRVFYGPHPAPKPAPAWVPAKPEGQRLHGRAGSRRTAGSKREHDYSRGA